MIEATLERWSAWSPGLDSHDAWRVWSKSPAPLASEGQPDAAFLPRMFRRRCGPLARVMLKTAFDCCETQELPEVATVFGSRHGNINESVDLLDRLARRQPLSPTTFSHTVHNAQAGLFSIAASNRCASSSISAQEDSFACTYLEAMTLLERTPERPVLLVIADVPLAATFARLIDEKPAAYGLALLLSNSRNGQAQLAFDPSPGPGQRRSPDWPDAIEFLRWLLCAESQLCLGRQARRWSWKRVAQDI